MEPEAWLEAVRREERRGEMLAAFDLAERGLDEHPDDLSLKHRAVLALARAGATGEAARRFADYGLDGIEDEDIAALSARIAKDAALAHRDPVERRRSAARAAELYRVIYGRTGGYYPAINAATLHMIAGDGARSRELAATVLGLLDAEPDDSYYAVATLAEARLLLGDEAGARAALARAAQLHDGDFGALATTRRQLRTICETLDLDRALLAPLAGPGVAVFCGHIIAAPGQPGRFAAEAERVAAAAIERAVDGRPPRYAYGALAGGADIMWAEALLARGCELHVVLPFAQEEFVELSVATCGAGWVARFEQCIEAATEVLYATNDAFLGDDVLFRYSGELAMGLALLRARYLDADVWQLALWDGRPAGGDAGAAIDVGTWRTAGHAVTVVTPAGETIADGEVDSLTASQAQVAAGGPRPRPQPGRVVRAMLFGDVTGFSKLTDEQLPMFTERILGAFAEVVSRYEDHVGHRNTWGDALYVVLSDVASAAACALDLQDGVAAIDLEAEGLPDHLALRLGGHVGPVFPVVDPVLREASFMGSHVSRTARIEPVTPPGAVYVTEAFAAALVLSADRELTCDYVGHMAAAKGYGKLRMYRLRRATGGDDPVP
jgi:hypothetical protein